MLSLRLTLLLILSCTCVTIIHADEWQSNQAYPMLSIPLAAHQDDVTPAVDMETSTFDAAQIRGFLPRRLANPPSNQTVILTMSGESRIEIPSDYAEISATVETVYNNMTGLMEHDQAHVIRDVTNRTATTMTHVLEVLRATPNVTKIRTTDVDLSPIYDYTRGSQRLVGYRASNSISFRVAIPSASPIMDAIIRAGISRINSVSYTASPERIAAARMRAIESAIADAQRQANTAASQIPTTAAPRITNIDMTGASSPSPFPMPYAPVMTMAREGAGAMAMPIVGGELVITAHARVKFVVDVVPPTPATTPTPTPTPTRARRPSF